MPLLAGPKKAFATQKSAFLASQSVRGLGRSYYGFKTQPNTLKAKIKLIILLFRKAILVCGLFCGGKFSRR